MSVLVHDCTKCGHRSDVHRQRGWATCSCCNMSDSLPPSMLQEEPRLHETFTYPGAHPEPLYQPGTRRNQGTIHATDVCGCVRCQELYAEMSAS